jgi:hypothetical protein
VNNPTNSTSFIKSLNFQTQIPPEFATIISIGAAANKKVVGEDTTAFSLLNKGLTTRFAETITDGNERINTPDPDETPNALLQAISPLVSWVAFGNVRQGRNIQWNLDTFASNKSILADLINNINKIKSKEDTNSSESTSSPTSGFIPVNISLTMDGLSGMKVFQKFDLDSSYLPSNYPNAVEILIKGISHTIQNNVWDTTIESVIVGKSSVKSLATSNPSSSTTDSKAQARGYVKQKTQPLGNANADKLRQTVSKLGYTEKGKEINSSGYDISSNIEKAASAVLTTIKNELPSVKITVTGGNDKYHQDSNSRHGGGNAIDFTVSPATNDVLDKIVGILQRYAAGNSPNFRFIDEYRIKTARATGKHFHISWGPGTEGQAQLNTSLALAKTGNINPIKIA